MNIPDFNMAFEDHSTLESCFGKLTFYQRCIGEVFLPSGSVAACDGFVCFEREPFTVRLSPGRYPVIASIAMSESGDERIACAMLRVTDARPVRWEMATTVGQDVTELSEGYIFGYPVDSGTGCFISAEALHVLNEKMSADPDYYQYIMKCMEGNYRHTRDWADIELDSVNKLNFVLFSSRVGDGFYGSYWGDDQNDRLACLVTDFGMLDGNTTEEES